MRPPDYRYRSRQPMYDDVDEEIQNSRVSGTYHHA